MWNVDDLRHVADRALVYAGVILACGLFLATFSKPTPDCLLRVYGPMPCPVRELGPRLLYEPVRNVVVAIAAIFFWLLCSRIHHGLGGQKRHVGFFGRRWAILAPPDDNLCVIIALGALLQTAVVSLGVVVLFTVVPGRWFISFSLWVLNHITGFVYAGVIGPVGLVMIKTGKPSLRFWGSFGVALSLLIVFSWLLG